MGAEAGAGDANGRVNTNVKNANPSLNATDYTVCSTPLNNNHLLRRKSVSTASLAEKALGSTVPEEGGAAVAAAANGATTSGHKKPPFQLGQPDEDRSALEDENSSSNASVAFENHHSSANANAPPSTTHTHSIRSNPHQHPTQQHTHTHPRQHPQPQQRQEDEDDEDRHLGLPPLNLRRKQQCEPSLGAVPFPRSSPLHSPVPGAVATAAASGGMKTRQGGCPFPYTPHPVSKSQSEPLPA